MFKQLIAVTPEDAKKIRVRCLDRQRWVLLHSSLGIIAEGDKFREIFEFNLLRKAIVYYLCAKYFDKSCLRL